MNAAASGQWRMVYQFRSRCEEEPELDYPDGLRYIYFNTKGTIFAGTWKDAGIRALREKGHAQV